MLGVLRAAALGVLLGIFVFGVLLLFGGIS